MAWLRANRACEEASCGATQDPGLRAMTTPANTTTAIKRPRPGTDAPKAAPLQNRKLDFTDAETVLEQISSLASRMIRVEQQNVRLVQTNQRLTQSNQQLTKRVQQLEDAAGSSQPGSPSSFQSASSSGDWSVCRSPDIPGESNAADASATHLEPLQQHQNSQPSRQHIPASAPSSEDKRPDSPRAQRNDLPGQLPSINRQLHRLEVAVRRNDVIVHAPSGFTQQQLLTKCNRSLQAAKTAKAPVSNSALRPMQTSNTGCKLWHLELDDQDAKHALFGDSKAFRQQGIYLDDHLTQQQLDGRRRLAPQRLRLKELGYRTWWRRDVLYWTVDGAVRMQRP